MAVVATPRSSSGWVSPSSAALRRRRTSWAGGAPTNSAGTVTIGDVTVVTGDYVLADEDGIVLVPAADVEEVVTASEAAAQVENKVRSAILQGIDPERAYLEYGKF